MKRYTDLDDFSNGVAKLRKNYSKELGMPVLLEVDGIKAPFGICTEQTVNGVKCLVFTGYSSLMKNILKGKNKVDGGIPFTTLKD